ncbi:MAG TPA: hypothetical protein VMF51_24635 [Nocardioides sp.]|uniref:hypothetical protein n=1 Tax=Nocardioides sp. TaxID=35761 RepID=UPI002B85E6CE|nr:hypothetical protein [Nocardioides sp.]HTW18334.1 hypothetical protein [Nocardioides sp.]
MTMCLWVTGIRVMKLEGHVGLIDRGRTAAPAPPVPIISVGSVNASVLQARISTWSVTVSGAW